MTDTNPIVDRDKGELQDEKVHPGGQLPPINQSNARALRARTVAIVLAGLALTAIGSGAWLWQSRPLLPAAQPESNTQRQQWVTVEPQSVSAKIEAVGTVAAGRSIPILAPFDGVVKEKKVQLGDHVEVGDVLVVLDTNEIASRYRDAQSAYLKAAMAAQEMEQWESNPEVQRARRAKDAAEAGLATLDQQVMELKALLDRGIVSRHEYDGLVQQRDTQAVAVAAAEDDLTATLSRGDADNRHLLSLELENATAKLADQKEQMAGASVVTAVAGIVVRPPDNATRPVGTQVEAGTSLTRGIPIFSIADTSSFIVTALVDEIDVNQIKPGQAVQIQSETFAATPLEGKIVSISAEAQGQQASGQAPTFEVRASFAAPDEATQQAIRVGMSARLTIQIYENPNALIVPPQAVLTINREHSVRIDRAGVVVNVPVLLGRTFPTGVEVVSGVSAGARVSIEPTP